MVRTWIAVAASVTAVGAGAAVFALSGACSSSSSGIGSAGGGGGPGSGTGCEVDAGQFPPANCDDSQDICNGGQCQIQEPKCGDSTTCLPMATNTPTQQNFRLRRLSIAAPYSLSEANSGIVQETVVDKGVNLNAPECGENGDGSFTLLMSIDRTNNVIKIGGAPPTQDPFAQGYCFVNYTAEVGDAAVPLQPIVGTTHFTGNTFYTDPIPSLQIAIFVSGNINNLVLLPLSNASFQDVTISPDGNCIGSLNPSALNAQCIDVRSDCQKWKTAGSLGGFITLDEADNVPISLLGGKSLCIFLTGASGTDIAPDGLHCARDASGKIILKGDYCSNPIGPGGCEDSYWLAATFAAAAVTINDGAGVPQCQASSGGNDGGVDSGSGGNDAGGD
jgi:hypothetical protein